VSLVVGIAGDLSLLLPNLGFLPKGFSYYTCPNFRYNSLLLTMFLVVLERLVIPTQGPLLGTYYSREVQVVASQLWAYFITYLLAPLVARNTLLIYIYYRGCASQI
jgi:hypothetical protein